MYGPTFSISEQSGLYKEALTKAFADARAKAQTIAAAAGVTLGAVVNIVEGGGVAPARPCAAKLAAESAASVPIEGVSRSMPATC